MIGGQQMPQASSVDAFTRSLNQRFNQLKESLAAQDVIATQGQGEHVRLPLSKVVEAARDLYNYYAYLDRPEWLPQVAAGFHRFGHPSLIHQNAFFPPSRDAAASRALRAG